MNGSNKGRGVKGVDEREREAIKRRERGAAKAACVGVSEKGFVVLFAVFPNDDKNPQYKKSVRDKPDDEATEAV